MIDLSQYCQSLCQGRPNLMVSWWLMASYAYYEMDDPIIDDATYDWLGRSIADAWDTIEHPHKDLLGGPEAVRHTGHHIQYPERVKRALGSLLRSLPRVRKQTTPDRGQKIPNFRKKMLQA